MSSLSKSQEIETAAIPQILQFLESMAFRVAPTDQQAFLQAVWGDFDVLKNNLRYGVELKVEQSDTYGNLFLETWSNRHWRTLGWLYKLRGDFLFYYFLQEKTLYTIQTPALLDWCFGVNDKPGQIYKYPERPQSKYSQKNDTWGRCVPLVILQKELGSAIKKHQLQEGDGQPVNKFGNAE